MEKLHQLFTLTLFSLLLNFCDVLAYFRFDKTLIVVHAKDVVTVKAWVANTPDGEKGLVSEEIDFLKEVTETEDRYSIFQKMDSSDRNISQQVFAFKLNACNMFDIQEKRENHFLNILKKHGYKSNVRCPFRKGSKIHSYNNTYDDSLFPPVHVEIIGRIHKEIYGRLKGEKKWTKLWTHDTFARVKK